MSVEATEATSDPPRGIAQGMLAVDEPEPGVGRFGQVSPMVAGDGAVAEGAGPGAAPIAPLGSAASGGPPALERKGRKALNVGWLVVDPDPWLQQKAERLVAFADELKNNPNMDPERILEHSGIADEFCKVFSFGVDDHLGTNTFRGSAADMKEHIERTADYLSSGVKLGPMLELLRADKEEVDKRLADFHLKREMARLDREHEDRKRNNSFLGIDPLAGAIGLATQYENGPDYSQARPLSKLTPAELEELRKAYVAEVVLPADREYRAQKIWSVMTPSAQRAVTHVMKEGRFPENLSRSLEGELDLMSEWLRMKYVAKDKSLTQGVVDAVYGRPKAAAEGLSLSLSIYTISDDAEHRQAAHVYFLRRVAAIERMLQNQEDNPEGEKEMMMAFVESVAKDYVESLPADIALAELAKQGGRGALKAAAGQSGKGLGRFALVKWLSKQVRPGFVGAGAGTLAGLDLYGTAGLAFEDMVLLGDVNPVGAGVAALGMGAGGMLMDAGMLKFDESVELLRKSDEINKGIGAFIKNGAEDASLELAKEGFSSAVDVGLQSGQQLLVTGELPSPEEALKNWGMQTLKGLATGFATGGISKAFDQGAAAAQAGWRTYQMESERYARTLSARLEHDDPEIRSEARTEVLRNLDYFSESPELQKLRIHQLGLSKKKVERMRREEAYATNPPAPASVTLSGERPTTLAGRLDEATEAVKRYQGQRVMNEETGMNVVIPRELAQREIRQAETELAKGNPMMSAMTVLDKGFASATIVGRKPHGGTGWDSKITMQTRMDSDGVPYLITYEVREKQGRNGNPVQELYDVKVSPAPPGWKPPQLAPPSTGEASPPTTVGSTEGPGLQVGRLETLEDARAEAKRFRGGKVYHEGTGREIAITGRIVDRELAQADARGSTVDGAQLDAAASVDRLLKTANHTRALKLGGKNGIAAIHTFDNTVTIRGEKRRVRMFVREGTDGKMELHEMIVGRDPNRKREDLKRKRR